nr:immunoglobulin heavy chain junction region [Mus musculus]NSM04693.1 immunoglobulin heavy chain junction region [Mus musculus]NSM04998.1 immunoglobulin heavy chain junction region [Mus musculus]NSM05817.1 immunoglobulin heavy chain junction region [Mus musculus]NSM06800.1 immunoglobulin heavy chain junction region [Mus musculus]
CARPFRRDWYFDVW